MRQEPAEQTSSVASARRDALAILARADPRELADAWQRLDDKPEFDVVRKPQIGLVMARGRIGGGGAPFNVGEVTVTRSVVAMASGEIGFGHVLGRYPEHSLLVARFDALWQNAGFRGFVENEVLAPIARRLDAEDEATRAKTAATRVNFFTMVRGEDA